MDLLSLFFIAISIILVIFAIWSLLSTLNKEDQKWAANKPDHFDYDFECSYCNRSGRLTFRSNHIEDINPDLKVRCDHCGYLGYLGSSIVPRAVR